MKKIIVSGIIGALTFSTAFGIYLPPAKKDPTYTEKWQTVKKYIRDGNPEGLAELVPSEIPVDKQQTGLESTPLKIAMTQKNQTPKQQTTLWYLLWTDLDDIGHYWFASRFVIDDDPLATQLYIERFELDPFLQTKKGESLSSLISKQAAITSQRQYRWKEYKKQLDDEMKKR